MVTEEEEKPRLYSKPPRVPADEIAPHHQEIHELLERWGSWQRVRYSPETCASMEKLYYKGGRDTTPPSTAPAAPDQKLVLIDQAWRLMVQRVPQHAEAIFFFYVGVTVGRGKVVPLEPQVICRRIRIHWSDFGRWMRHCRAMVINLMKELER